MANKPSPDSIVSLLADPSRTLIIDGALATELEAQGANLADPLWSCKTLLEQPSLIKAVHLAYFHAGADIAITASYQASPKGLAEQRGMSLNDSKSLVRKSVQLAQEARDEYRAETGETRALLVAGSVGPYGAYLADGSEYRGDYHHLSEQELKTFHRPRIEALVEAGVDLLAIETMPNYVEVAALTGLLCEEFADSVAWVGCSLRDGDSISDGTSLRKVAELLENSRQVTAAGVNCVPPELVTPTLRILRRGTSKPLLCYPNSGETWDAVAKTWDGSRGRDSNDQWQGLVAGWKTEGAQMVGGCCRTGPKDIQAIKSACSSI